MTGTDDNSAPRAAAPATGHLRPGAGRRRHRLGLRASGRQIPLCPASGRDVPGGRTISPRRAKQPPSQRRVRERSKAPSRPSRYCRTGGDRVYGPRSPESSARTRRTHHGTRLPACRARDELVGQPGHAGPKKCRHQTMRIWHVVQIERVGRRNAWGNSNPSRMQQDCRRGDARPIRLILPENTS